jgi:hypothetical protein
MDQNLPENNSVTISTINFIKTHYRTIGIAGAVIGALLVIYYCSSINFYPSGLTIGDSLFFLWAIIIFGFYYSITSIVFFLASIFWILALEKPINLIIKFKPFNINIKIPSITNGRVTIIIFGLFSNIILLAVSYIKHHTISPIIATILIVMFAYTLSEDLHETIKNDINNDVVKNNSTNKISNTTVKSIFYTLIYAAPLITAQLGGGLAKTTFETMGIRQLNVTVVTDQQYIKKAFDKTIGLEIINELSCAEECIIKNIDILFTNIGVNTKLELKSKNGPVGVVVPSKDIKVILSHNSNISKVSPPNK